MFRIDTLSWSSNIIRLVVFQFHFGHFLSQSLTVNRTLTALHCRHAIVFSCRENCRKILFRHCLCFQLKPNQGIFSILLSWLFAIYIYRRGGGRDRANDIFLCKGMISTRKGVKYMSWEEVFNACNTIGACCPRKNT